MRRNSPPRFPRRNSPPRRGGRPRSLSPPSRSQPPPPGEERSRKVNPWDAHKRPRSRSRSRERLVRAREDRDRLRGRVDREPPVICIVDEEPLRGRFDRGRELGREPNRDLLRKEEERRERSRERRRERDRAFHASRMAENTEAKQKHHHKRHPLELNQDQNDGFEENYLDQQKGNFGITVGFHNNHEEPLLDPSSITLSAYPHPPEISRDHPRDTPRNIRPDIRPDARPDARLDTRLDARLDTRLDARPDTRRPPVRTTPKNSFGKHEKEENAEDRINRLEKLVEKLVKGNVTPTKPKENTRENSYPKSKEVFLELIPGNSKFTTSMWINRIHEECLHRNYDEKSSIRYMQDKMTGIMKAWFKSVSNYDFTWPELKLLITKTFPDNVDFAQTLKLLVARDKTSEETITQYYFSKVYLCEACKIAGENAVSCLIDGLSNPFMKQDIKSYNFLTPEALYSEYLCKFPEHDVPVRVEHREVRIEHREESEYHNEEFIPLEIQDRDRDYRMPPDPLSTGGERFVNRLAEHPLERPLERQKCFTCKKFGHLAVDCRHAPICYNCKKKGHIAAKCHFNNVMLVSAVGSTQRTAPVVRCEVQGKEFDGVIDTGAMPVTMQSSLATYLQLNLKKTSEVLRGYSGSTVSALGEAYVTLKVNSAQRVVKVLIVDDKVQDDPLIVGQEFLSRNVSLLIQNDQVYIADTGITGNM